MVTLDIVYTAAECLYEGSDVFMENDEEITFGSLYLYMGGNRYCSSSAASDPGVVRRSLPQEKKVTK